MKITFDISSLSPLDTFRNGSKRLTLELEKRVALGEHLHFYITIECTILPNKPGENLVSSQIAFLVNEQLKKETAFQLLAKEFGVSVDWLYVLTERCANEYERSVYLFLTTLPSK